MNEKLQYASMIEVPVSTCNITYKPLKKRKKKKPITEDVKQEVIKKVNSEIDSLDEVSESQTESEIAVENSVRVYSADAKKESKHKFKLTAISVQIMIIGALIVTIFLTNAFNSNSGINTFFKGVFGSEQTVETDSRKYSDFAPTLIAGENTVIGSDGVITIEKAGSVYSVCNGTVKTVVLDEDTQKYTIKVSHSDNFTSVYTGLDFAYATEGATVYSNIPLGYAEAQAELCFYSGDAVITDYQIIEDTVVWAV